MPHFRVDVTYQRVQTFYVEAEDRETVEAFMDGNPEWAPRDVPGLIDVVSEENEVDYSVVTESEIVPNFVITGALELKEVEQ